MSALFLFSPHCCCYYVLLLDLSSGICVLALALALV